MNSELARAGDGGEVEDQAIPGRRLWRSAHQATPSPFGGASRAASCVAAFLFVCLGFVSPAAAQNDFRRLHSFGNPSLSAATPYATLIEGTNGRLYGTTFEGGSNNFGTVFQVNRSGDGFATLHSFTGGNGANPQAGLLRGSDGALYGTTFSGGSSNRGTIFKLNTDGSSFAVLHNFAGGADGANPQAALAEGTNGALYGMTGGTNSTVTVFRLNKDGAGHAVLLGTNGGIGYLTVGGDGLLYGTTYNGGISNRGSVFRIDHQGNGFSNLHHFTGSAGDGKNPLAGVIQGTNGRLYGTTFAGGGSNDLGTVFRLNADGTGYWVLHSFAGSTADGWHPAAPLAQGSNGVFYGTTFLGGSHNRGVVFKLDGEGNGYSVLRSFSWSGNDPRSPRAGLLPASDGLLYGATTEGGNSDEGAVFQLSADGSGFAVVFSFTWSGGDGVKPMAELLEASDGMLYGTTRSGGASDYGTIFRQSKDGSGYAVLHNFNWNPDGGCPQAGLLEGGDGALYGTAYGGGSTNFGTVFKLNKDGGAFTVLHSFTNNSVDGAFPQAALVKGTNGSLYGTTSSGGVLGFGTVFRLEESGSGYSVLRDIAGSTAGIGPASRLIVGKDGSLYGTTVVGGVLFRLNHDGSGFAVMSRQSNATAPGTDPSANLLAGEDGTIYGTTYGVSGANSGTVFRLDQNLGSNVVLYAFTGNTNGRNPVAGLARSGTRLYGTTLNGDGVNNPAATNAGTIFRLNADGSGFATLFGFTNAADGRNPSAGLTVASDGAIYGTTLIGGDLNAGVSFSLAYPPVFTGLDSVSTGALVHFTGTASRTYAVQATTNLGVSVWQTIAPYVTSTNSAFFFFDADATNHPVRFYRTSPP